MPNIRPTSHEIDTLARRKVPSAFPTNWEHRETTGRDYGIDMLFEYFEQNQGTGFTLMVQIKGTTQTLAERDDYYLFDMPVNNLKYSLLFTSPVLLALCPVEAETPKFYYLWLQDFIRVILDKTTPHWRENTSTVRVRIPKTNIMPGNESNLAHIAKYSNRLYDSNQAWWRMNEIRKTVYNIKRYENFETIDNIEGREQLLKGQIKRALSLLQKVRDLPSIFSDNSWAWGQEVRIEYVEKVIKLFEWILSSNPSPQRDNIIIELQLLVENILDKLNEMNNEAIKYGNYYLDELKKSSTS